MNQKLLIIINLFLGLLIMNSSSDKSYAQPVDPFPAVKAVNNALNEIDQSHKNDYQLIRNKPILKTQYNRGPVLVSHPYKNEPAIWRVNTYGQPLRLSVYPHSKGNSRIEVWVSGKRIFNKEINDHKWHDLRVPLASNINQVDVRHYATGWHWEYLYFARLEGQSSDPFPAVKAVNNALNEIDQSHKNDYQLIRNKPILKTQYNRGPVLVSHPYKNEPAIWRVNTYGQSLRLSVYPHSKGNSRIEVWASGRLVFNKEINDHTWHDLSVPLTSNVKEVEIRHYPTGWSWEYLYFSILGPSKK